MSSRRSAFVLLVPALAAALLVGCGEAEENTPRTSQRLETFVGRVQGSNAYIALIHDGKDLAGYTTDGRVISIWFAKADLDDGKATLVQRSGPEVGEVEIEDDSASGDIQLGPRSFSFTAERASGIAGLYESAELTEGNSFQAGWIVLPDGSERAMMDTYIGGKTDSVPAPKLTPTVNIPGFGPQLPHVLTSIYFITLPEAPD